MSLNAESFVAFATIQPSTFVSLVTNAGALYNVQTSNGASDSRVIGVAQAGTKFPQGVGSYTGEAADATDPIQVYGPADVCLLLIGAGGCTAGDWLAPDANGNGVTMNLTAVNTQQFYGAKALETALAGQLARVLVNIGIEFHN